jgi:hypothetical protein
MATVALSDLLRESSWTLSTSLRGALVTRIAVRDGRALAAPGPVREALERYLVERQEGDPTIEGLLCFLVANDGSSAGYVELRRRDGVAVWDGPHGDLDR